MIGGFWHRGARSCAEAHRRSTPEPHGMAAHSSLASWPRTGATSTDGEKWLCHGGERWSSLIDLEVVDIMLHCERRVLFVWLFDLSLLSKYQGKY